MLGSLVLVEFESQVRLPLPAAEHFLTELILTGSVAPMPTDEFSSLLDSRVRFGFAFVAVFPMKCGADWALHRRMNLSDIVPDRWAGKGATLGDEQKRMFSRVECADNRSIPPA